MSEIENTLPVSTINTLEDGWSGASELRMSTHHFLNIFKSEYSYSLYGQLGSIHLSLYLHSKARRPSIQLVYNHQQQGLHSTSSIRYPNQTTKDVVGDTNIVISIHLFLIVETVAEELPFDNNPQPAQHSSTVK